MTKQIEVRPLMPHIYRAWDAPSGRMVWKCNEQSAGRWGLGISLGLKLDWRRAWKWCQEQNAKADLVAVALMASCAEFDAQVVLAADLVAPMAADH